MTKVYEQLKEKPQTQISRSSLNPDERAELRTIEVKGLTGRSVSNPKGNFTTIYYLAGDERAAVTKFVEQNREVLEQIDFSKKDRIQTSVNREIYDLILDELGVREITKYATVVLEKRSDGTKWVIDRQKFESNPSRRYTTGENGSVRIPSDVSIEEIYNRSDQIITQDKLANENIEGDNRQLLDYYRVCDAFDCQPCTTADSQLAIKKIDHNADSSEKSKQ